MVKAIILDWGGVLIDNPVPGFMAYCCQYFKVPKELFIKTASKFYEDFSSGRITENIFWRKVCSRLSVAEPSIDSLLGEAFKSVYFEKSDVISFVSSLKKKGYKLALLSNTEMPMLKCFREKNYDFFDTTVFSCLEGITKPDKKIYGIILERLRVEPHEAVFIDDKEENIAAAKSLGIKTILFEGFEQFKKELLSFL